MHPNIKCFAFSGGAVRKYAILQVRGFQSLIASGTVIQVVIPDIKSCTAYDLQCFVTLSTAYTTELDEPYTLNIEKFSVAMVAEGSLSMDISTGVAVDPLVQ